MIILEEGQNTPAATCSRNGDLSNPFYVWNLEHKLSSQSWTFVPYRISPSVDYKPAYDLFTLNIDYNIPEFLTGGTQSGATNVHLLDGEYYLSVYESNQQTLNTSNLNMVYQTITQVNLSGDTQPVQYTGTSDVFIVYEG